MLFKTKKKLNLTVLASGINFQENKLFATKIQIRTLKNVAFVKHVIIIKKNPNSRSIFLEIKTNKDKISRFKSQWIAQITRLPLANLIGKNILSHLRAIKPNKANYLEDDV